MENKLKRTHYCGQLSKENVGESVTICGFVQRSRNLGNLIFIDIRDRSGIVQIALDHDTDSEIFKTAQEVRSEYVVACSGMVRERQSVNTEISTGDIEMYVTEFSLLAKAETPPFEITDTTNVKEELRLKYRYLDLRRSEMQKILAMRHRITKVARDYYDRNGFLEIETPMLIKSTPEGARDYLVPSRVHPGSFFALPQSPQLYKQLLMLSGCDRYMQIARCFRDEDLRADRQPEFTQIDIEMSFVDEEDVMSVNEGFAVELFKKVLDKDIPAPFKKMPYDEAMNRFGSDKPDTRFGLELINLTDLLSTCEFKVFSDALTSGGSVRAINVKNAASTLTRKEIDKLVEFVKIYKAKGLAYSRYSGDAVTSSFEKFLSADEVKSVYDRVNFEPNDVLLIVADKKNNVVFDSLGALRCHLGEKLNLIPEDSFEFLWVTDFPLFEYDEDENRYVAKHHPFTCPKLDEIDKLETDPGSVKARAYDLVLNGCEIGGGSIRIHDQQLQWRMFRALGFSEDVAYERFGFLLDAFKYGAPPHGGMAYGLDRLVMLILNRKSIRDVIAFPKVQNSSELMTMCPAPVDASSLKELHLTIDV